MAMGVGGGGGEGGVVGSLSVYAHAVSATTGHIKAVHEGLLAD